MTGVHGADVTAILRAQPRPQHWTALEVRRWLEAIELAVYASTFEAAGVQGADLICMDADALKRRLGVAHLGHRTKLLKEIAVLASRAMLSTRRGEENQAKDFAQKRKELLDTMYPDRVRRELKAQQDRILLETRANFWRPEDRRALGAVDDTGGARRAAASNRQHPDDNLIIHESSATNQHRAPFQGGHAAQQRALTRPSTGMRSRAPRVGGSRPRTAGTGRPVSTDTPLAGRPDAVETQEQQETEEFKTPKERMEEVRERISALEEKSDYEELIKAWVEYGACVRMEYGDKDQFLVRTHFNLATTYLRQKLVYQALCHFKEAELVNKVNAAADDALSYKCRILEGMGICETRLGHFKAAHGLLQEACCLCMKKAMGPDASDEAVEQAIAEMDIENIEDQEGTVASVLVAKSELYSAQADYDNAIKCLTDAYMLKEAVLGSDHKQIGKLYSALGTISQKQMQHKLDLLQDVKATLESAVRIRKEIEDKTEGIVLKGLEQEKGLDQLLRDIANMQDKEEKLQREVRTCKADVLDFMNRARKISAAHGEAEGETVKLTKLVANLAKKFAEEESERVGWNVRSENVNNVSVGRDEAAEQTRQWLAKNGMDAEDWGLSATESKGAATEHEQTEMIISNLRASAS